MFSQGYIFWHWGLCSVNSGRRVYLNFRRKCGEIIKGAAKAWHIGLKKQAWLNENGKYGRKMCLSTQSKEVMKMNNEVEELENDEDDDGDEETTWGQASWCSDCEYKYKFKAKQIQRQIQIQRNHLRSGRLLFWLWSCIFSLIPWLPNKPRAFWGSQRLHCRIVHCWV